MNKDLRLYGNNFNHAVIKDIEKLNEKIKEETSQEELLKLRMQRLYRGMEINNNMAKRGLRGYYPY